MRARENVARQLINDLGIELAKPRPTASSRWAGRIAWHVRPGPALLVNDSIYTQVTPEKVHGILDECRRTFGAHATAGKEHAT